MIALSQHLAKELHENGVTVFGARSGFTKSHQFAVEAASFGGGQAASKKLRQAGFLACGIGLPIAPVEGDMNGLRIGTPELVRRGVTAKDAPKLAGLIARALKTNDPVTLAGEVSAYRAEFNDVHFVLQS
jgi:glycine hydroxymethyltransferase